MVGGKKGDTERGSPAHDVRPWPVLGIGQKQDLAVGVLATFGAFLVVAAQSPCPGPMQLLPTAVIATRQAWNSLEVVWGGNSITH